MTLDQALFRSTLPLSDPDWQGMGALTLRPDPRDRSITAIPAVARQLAAGVPADCDLSALIQGAPYNQGALPACVAYSTAGLASMDDVAETGHWETFDAYQMYTRAGGNGSNGVETRLVLSQATDAGVPKAGGGAAKLIGSYAFVPQDPGSFVEVLKAALAAGCPCTLALLLPTNFGAESSGSMTQGYHQVVAIGYRASPPAVRILNSWGIAWGHNGTGWIPWDYLLQANLQQKYVYAYTVTPLKLAPVPTPTPTPAKKIFVTGIANGAGAAGITVGQTLTMGNVSATLTVTDVRHDTGPDPDPVPTPNPPPGTLTPKVTDFRGGVQVTAQDAAGQYVTATVTASVDAGVLVPFRTQTFANALGTSATPATFSLRGAWHTLVVTVTAGAQSGTLTLTN